jgi:flagellar P-ring protein FlgI
MRRKLQLLLHILMALLTGIPSGFAVGVRVKDISLLAGARDNQLVGYGLVAGLAGKGDKNPTYTVQTMANVLQRFGVNIPSSTIQSKNVAV